jgi:TonB family protein
VVDGNDEFASVLRKTVDGRSIGSHPIVVRRLHADDDLKVCHLIFFRSSGRKQIQAAISGLDGASVRLVGEDETFLRQGGMINLVLRHGKIRFDVDRAALDQGKLQLSAQLLALADSDQPSAADTQASGASRQITVGPLPEYPEIAQRMNLKGTVRAEAVVRPDGTVREVRVTGGHPVLADALVKAVKGWRYERSTKETVEAVKYVFDQ